MFQMTWHRALSIVGCVVIVAMVALGIALPFRSHSYVSEK